MRVANLLGEPSEDPAILIGVVPGVVADSRVLLICDLHVEVLHRLHPAPADLNRDSPVGVAGEEVDGHVRGVDGEGRIEAGVGWTDRGDGGPDIGMVQTKQQRAHAAHGESGEVDAVLVDWEASLDVAQHVKDVGFGHGLIGHGAAALRGGDDEVDILPGREDERGGGVILAGPVALAEDAAEIDAMVGPGAVEADDERVLLAWDKFGRRI